MYQAIKRNWERASPMGVVVIRKGKTSWTPSSSKCIGKVKLDEFHNCLGVPQRKRRWIPFSISPQLAQHWSIWVEYLPALLVVARALLLSLQVKVLRKGGVDLAFHTFCKMEFSWGVKFLLPCCGRLWCWRSGRCVSSLGGAFVINCILGYHLAEYEWPGLKWCNVPCEGQTWKREVDDLMFLFPAAKYAPWKARAVNNG